MLLQLHQIHQALNIYFIYVLHITRNDRNVFQRFEKCGIKNNNNKMASVETTMYFVQYTRSLYIAGLFRIVIKNFVFFLVLYTFLSFSIFSLPLFNEINQCMYDRSTNQLNECYAVASQLLLCAKCKTMAWSRGQQSWKKNINKMDCNEKHVHSKFKI